MRPASRPLRKQFIDPKMGLHKDRDGMVEYAAVTAACATSVQRAVAGT